MRVHIPYQFETLQRKPDPVQADGVDPLENVRLGIVARSATVFVVKAHDLFKAGDDPLLARRASA
ncbi:MAG: hypothetical protein WEB53_07820 [Akkermansiaceae bacterium]